MRRFNINDISKDYIAKEITKDNALDAFNIMKANPLYFDNLREEASISHVYHDIEALPPNKEYKDKYYFGLYKNNDMIAIIYSFAYIMRKTKFSFFFIIRQIYVNVFTSFEKFTFFNSCKNFFISQHCMSIF